MCVHAARNSRQRGFIIEKGHFKESFTKIKRANLFILARCF